MTLTADRASFIERNRWTPTTLDPSALDRLETVESDTDEETNDGSSGILLQAQELADEFNDSAVALARLAQAELAHGHRVSAIQAARQALAHATDDDQGAVAAAISVLVAVGESQEAYDLIEEAALGYSVAPGLLAADRGVTTRAEEWLGANTDVVSQSVIGWIQLQRADYRGALKHLRRASQQSGASGAVYTNLGYAYAATGSLTKAIRWTQRALEVSPNNQVATLNLSAFLMSIGDTDGARAALRTLSAHHPGLRISRLQIDLDLRAGGSKVLALKALEKLSIGSAWSTATDTDRAELQTDLVLLRRVLNLLDSTSAIKQLADALEMCSYQSLEIARSLSHLLRNPSQADLLAAVADRLPHDPQLKLPLYTRLHQLRGDFDKAIRSAEEWMEAMPFDPDAPTALSHMLCDYSGNYPEAVLVCRHALKRTPDARFLLNNLAYALASQGMLSQAKRVLRNTPTHPASLATGGFIALLQGRLDEGRAAYHRAAELAASEEPELVSAIQRRYYVALIQSGFAGPDDIRAAGEGDDSISHVLMSSLLSRIDQQEG